MNITYKGDKKMTEKIYLGKQKYKITSMDQFKKGMDITIAYKKGMVDYKKGKVVKKGTNLFIKTSDRWSQRLKEWKPDEEDHLIDLEKFVYFPATEDEHFSKDYASDLLKTNKLIDAFVMQLYAYIESKSISINMFSKGTNISYSNAYKLLKLQQKQIKIKTLVRIMQYLDLQLQVECQGQKFVINPTEEMRNELIEISEEVMNMQTHLLPSEFSYLRKIMPWISLKGEDEGVFSMNKFFVLMHLCGAKTTFGNAVVLEAYQESVVE